MSRGRKKNPFVNNAGSSNREDKRKSNRIFRRVSKIQLIKEKEPPKNIREVSDEWCFAGDGKCRMNPDNPYYNKMIRK